MSIALIIVAALYGLGILAFFILVSMETRKSGEDISILHFVVALVWPIWLTWYGIVRFNEWRTK